MIASCAAAYLRSVQTSNAEHRSAALMALAWITQTLISPHIIRPNTTPVAATCANAISMKMILRSSTIIPNAAARDPLIKFTLIIAGPAVSVGHENVYSDLTDERGCGAAGMSIAEAEEKISSMDPRGFDPRPDLRSMTQPGYWVFGLNDISVPINLSAAFLGELVADGKPFTVLSILGANHGMGMAPCRGGASAPDWIEPMFEWLLANA